MDNHTMIKKLETYDEFISCLNRLGFMPFSSNRVGFPSLESLTSPGAWHTGLDTDPWRWKDRIAGERKAAYARLFERKPGFISLEWYPYFLALRRRGKAFEALYNDGLLSGNSKRVYQLVRDRGVLATHEIKALAGFGSKEKSRYEAAVTELQMNMFITVYGMTRMIGASGEPHSWPVTAYSTVEEWAGDDIIADSREIDPGYAGNRIIERIQKFTMEADEARITKFAG